MTPAEFSKALLQSAKALDVPAAGAKARAVAHVASAVGAGAAAGAGAGAGAAGAAGAGAGGGAALAGAATTSKLGLVTWSLVAAGVIAAGAVGVALTRTADDHPTPVVAVAPSGGAPSVAPALVPDLGSTGGAAPAAASGHDDGAAAAVDACMMHPLPDGRPTACSKKGKPVPFDLRNTCAGDVDIFWVDYDCQEVFHHRLPNGESWTQVTQDAHVWRVRDHATHALVKEFSAQRLPGAPDLTHAGEGPPRVLADVIVHDVDASSGAPGAPGAPGAEETPPAVCSGMGAPSRTTVKNERDAQIVIMWVGLDCKEKYWERVEPKKTIVLKGRDGDAWRIRDAKTAQVLVDILPDAPDTTTYITLP